MFKKGLTYGQKIAKINIEVEIYGIIYFPTRKKTIIFINQNKIKFLYTHSVYEASMIEAYHYICEPNIAYLDLKWLCTIKYKQRKINKMKKWN